jgi:hypothetical protein
MAAHVHVALASRLKLKLWENIRWYLWFGFIRLPSEKYKIMSWKKKKFKDLKDFLVSCRLYFVIAEDGVCIATMYYLLL